VLTPRNLKTREDHAIEKTAARKRNRSEKNCGLELELSAKRRPGDDPYQGGVPLGTTREDK